MASKVQPGQSVSFSASLRNDTIDMIDWWKRGGWKRDHHPQGAPDHDTRIYLKNASAANRRQGEVLKIGSFLTTAVNINGLNTFSGSIPTASDDDIAVLIQDAPYSSDQVAVAQVSGVVPALVDIQTSGDRWANIDPNSAILVSSTIPGRFRVLYAPTGTGEQSCVILLNALSGERSVMYSVIQKTSGGSTLGDWNASSGAGFVGQSGISGVSDIWRGTIGFYRKTGIEQLAGIEYDIAEPDKHANGTFTVSANLRLRFSFLFHVRIEVASGSGTWPNKTYNSDSYTCTTSHYHTIDLPDIDYVTRGPQLDLRLYEKSADSAIAVATNDDTGERSWGFHYPHNTNDNEREYSHFWEFDYNFEANKRYSLRAIATGLNNDGVLSKLSFLRENGFSFLRVTNLGSHQTTEVL